MAASAHGRRNGPLGASVQSAWQRPGDDRSIGVDLAQQVGIFDSLVDTPHDAETAGEEGSQEVGAAQVGQVLESIALRCL
jgi:hypothetical protein